MRRLALLVLVLPLACRTPAVKPTSPPPAPAPAPVAEKAILVAVAAPFDGGPADAGPAESPDAGALVVAEVDSGPPQLAEEEAPDDQGESAAGELADGPPAIAGDGGILYTADIDDDTLKQCWHDDLKALGSVSIGFADQGRLVNGVQFPTDTFILSDPPNSYCTQETVDYVAAAVKQVQEWHPGAPKLQINHGGAREGGYLRPHESHQSGRDVDVSFYYPGGVQRSEVAREKVIDVELCWSFVKALMIHTDVQFVLVDRRVQKVLYDHALAKGEDKAWLDSLFFGKDAVIQHVRRHRNHFHVRFYNARAQELGRRVAPLLAERPEQNLLMVRVKKGDTLGAIAHKLNSTVVSLRKANNLKGSNLRIGQVLKVPIRGVCTNCPVPPPVVLPPRHLPPDLAPPKPEALRALAPDARCSAD
jgi:hypothetical protein